MPRSRTVLSLCAFLVVATNAFGQSATSLAAPVYVSVAFNAAVLQTAEAQHVFKDLQVKFAPRQTHLQQLNVEIESLKKQLSDNAVPLSEADKSVKLQTLDTEQRQLQREADDFKADTDTASQQAFQVVAQKLYVFLQGFAKQHNYTLVIDRGSDAAPVVWYATANADITADLIKAYDLTLANPKDGTNSNSHLPSAPPPH